LKFLACNACVDYSEKEFSNNGRTEAKNFHVYKDKQNVKVDIRHKWSSEEETLLVLC
jgi:hypothetical protein